MIINLNILKKNINILIIFIYTLILYNYNFKGNESCLLIITSIAIILLYSINKRNINNIEAFCTPPSPDTCQITCGTLINFSSLDEEGKPCIYECQPGDGECPHFDISDITTPSFTLRGSPFENLIKRIKNLEDMIYLKQWSSAQSYEITDLKKKLSLLKEGGDGSEEEDGGEEDLSNVAEHPSMPTPQPLRSLNPIQPMGKYDNLCINSMVKSNTNTLVDDNTLSNYMGSTIPLVLEKTEGGLEGPSVDGEDVSPKKLSIFSNNNSSISCCDDSPFFTSTGCVCLTNNQENYISERGGNHVLEKVYNCPA